MKDVEATKVSGWFVQEEGTIRIVNGNYVGEGLSEIGDHRSAQNHIFEYNSRTNRLTVRSEARDLRNGTAWEFVTFYERLR
ncbi:MAG: hypothetical protein FWC79_02885 [Oscillospiraceae bacterium]|nr:hypothetical protein [Oscillospiraceae bacterium]